MLRMLEIDRKGDGFDDARADERENLHQVKKKELSWIRIVQPEPVPAILGDQLVLVTHCMETITVDVLK